LPPSKFGVVEITRERVKPVTEVETTEKCPSCDGKGTVESSLLFTEEIEGVVRLLSQEGTYKALKIQVNPMVEAYLNRGILKSISKTWRKKYKLKLKVEAVSNYHLLEYHIFDNAGEEIVT
ncbi:MAG: ribonuclease E/G, partial [Flavobacteriales bacterium]